MKVTIEQLSPVQRKLNFEIPPERVGEEMAKAYRTFQNTARIKGFRAGKAPRSLVERHFGEQVASEVSSLLVEESYAQALEEHHLPVVTRPQIVVEKLVLGQPFRYSATVEVRPDLTAIDYEGIEAEKQVRKVEDKEIESALNRLAETFAQLHPITDRDRIEQADIVRLDYTASVNGKLIPGMQGKDRLIEMGKESLFPGFQEHLLNTRLGAVTEFTLPLPESEESSGNPSRFATFRVTARELTRKEIPPLDDEFAKDHGECDTLEELRERVSHNLQQALDRRADSQVEEEIISQLLNRNPFEVPPSLVREQELRILMDAGLLRPGGDFLAAEAALPETWREQFVSQAQRQVQAVLLLDALVTQLGLVVTEEEVNQRIEEFIAANSAERRQQIEALYGRHENRHSLEKRLLHEKALHFVIARAKVKVVEKGGADEEEMRGVAGEEEKD